MRPHGPWQVISSRLVYQNPWLRVREDEVIRPDGKPGIYGVVEPADNAAIVAIDDALRVALVREFLYPHGVESVQIPSGGVEPGETPLAAAQRELREETGLQAAQWEPLGQVYLSGGISTQVSTVFLARWLTHGVATPDGAESLTVLWAPLEDALAMVDDSRILDAPSIAGIVRAARVVGRRPDG